MLEIKIDNPKLETLLETALEALLSGATLSKPGVIAKLPSLSKSVETQAKESTKEASVETFISQTDNPEDLAILQQLEFPQLKEAEKVIHLKAGDKKRKYVLNAEGFPFDWKKKALDKISAKQAFILKQIDEDAGAGMGKYIHRFRNWLEGTNKIILEKVNNQTLYIPIWEDRGITKVAGNAIEMKSKIAKLAEQAEKEPEALAKEDIKLLKEAGITVKV